MWAPAPLAVRRGYVLYFTALRRHGRVHCLVAATARRAVGPFRVRRTLSCGDRQGRGYIDPAPVRDPRGRIHLYFSVDGPVHDISVFRLSRDGLHLGGRRHVVVRANRGWHRNLVTPTVEGPSVVRRGRRYYLFYSAGAWESDYRMGYAVGTSPTGPFRDQPSSPILRPGGSLVAPGGGTVFTGPGGRPWLAYHAWTGALGYRRGGQRTLRMAPLRWRGDRVTVTLRR
jgi:hypothetical protein